MADTTPEQPFPMRLQKFLARAGVASRRGSEDLMTAGRVSVNGRVVTELGSKVDPKVDTVCVDGREVHLEDGSVYLMLYKPKGYLTTMDDPQGRPASRSSCRVIYILVSIPLAGSTRTRRACSCSRPMATWASTSFIPNTMSTRRIRHMWTAFPAQRRFRHSVTASCSTTVSRRRHGFASSPNARWHE